MLSRTDRIIVGASAVLTVVAAILHYAHAHEVLSFVVSGLALAVLAALVGRSVEQVADRLGSGATGVVQSALGNLPELFVCIFALRDHLVKVVEAAIIGSILGNILLVLGLSFMVGGLRNGRQRFDGGRARTLIALMILAVAAMLVPSLASYVHTPAAQHEHALSDVAAVVLLLVFALSVAVVAGRGAGEAEAGEDETSAATWPTGVAIAALAVTGVLAALVSDWFVDALSPALGTLHISQAFAGLVIVAIAGNAVENVVGIQLAARNRPDHALSVILELPAPDRARARAGARPAVAGDRRRDLHPRLPAAAGDDGRGIACSPSASSSSTASPTGSKASALLGLYVVVAASFWWG